MSITHGGHYHPLRQAGQSDRRDTLRPGYGHPLRNLKAAQAAITSQRRFFPTRYGTEFTIRAILKWAGDNAIDWHYIDPGKLQQNSFIESYNGSLRDEVLNEETFVPLPHGLPGGSLCRVDGAGADHLQEGLFNGIINPQSAKSDAARLAVV